MLMLVLIRSHTVLVPIDTRERGAQLTLLEQHEAEELYASK